MSCFRERTRSIMPLSCLLGSTLFSRQRILSSEIFLSFTAAICKNTFLASFMLLWTSSHRQDSGTHLRHHKRKCRSNYNTQFLKESGIAEVESIMRGRVGTEDIERAIALMILLDTDHQNNKRGKAGADITIDRFLQFLMPYANPLSSIRELA